MAQHWQEIVPADHYSVASNGLIHEYDRKVITFLYQPLIGPVCLSLYLTLWAELEENRLWSGSSSHHGLMAMTGMNLKDIYHARLRLEGMGLLKTHVKNGDDGRFFIYELQPPLTPEQFFLDGMLNIYLYRKIGKNQFNRLKRFFSDKAVSNLDEYEEITKAFQDVFSSVSPDALQSHQDDMGDLLPLEEETFIGKKEAAPLKIDPASFDFDLLEGGLKESLVPRSAFTPQVRESISKLAFLYGINAVQMKNIVISSLTADSRIDIEEMRKAARDWYQFEHQDQLPALLDRTQRPKVSAAAEEPLSDEDKLIAYFETVSPRQLLYDVSDGAAPAASELQMVEEIMFKQKLQPGVANVLVHYVMLRTDMKLTKGFIEKIASHWSRKKVRTVKEAMGLAKQEHKQYLAWAEEKKGKPGQAKRQGRKELLPDWFGNETATGNGDTQTDLDYEEEKRKLEEELKKFKSGR